MLKILVENHEKLTEEKKQAYAALLEPKLAHRVLEGRNPFGIKEGELVLLGAYQEGKLVGCVSYAVYPILKAADLFYISVASEFQRQGIALSLLNFLKDDLKKRRLIVCWATYVQENPSTPALQALFAKAGWSEPYHEIIRIYIDAWEYRSPFPSRPLPRGCEIFKWVELTDAEREDLKYRENQGSIPKFVSPFSKKYAVEPLTSLGIRCNGSVIGWLVTHRISKDTIRYSVYYVSPEFRGTNCFLELGNRAMGIQNESPIQWTMFEINFGLGNSTWRRFAMRVLAPHAKKIENVYISTLKLAD